MHIAREARAETLRRLFGQRQQRTAGVGDAGADHRAESARERLLDKPRQGSREIGDRRRKGSVTLRVDQLRPAFGMCEQRREALRRYGESQEGGRSAASRAGESMPLGAISSVDAIGPQIMRTVRPACADNRSRAQSSRSRTRLAKPMAGSIACMTSIARSQRVAAMQRDGAGRQVEPFDALQAGLSPSWSLSVAWSGCMRIDSAR